MRKEELALLRKRINDPEYMDFAIDQIGEFSAESVTGGNPYIKVKDMRAYQDLTEKISKLKNRVVELQEENAHFRTVLEDISEMVDFSNGNGKKDIKPVQRESKKRGSWKGLDCGGDENIAKFIKTKFFNHNQKRRLHGEENMSKKDFIEMMKREGKISDSIIYDGDE